MAGIVAGVLMKRRFLLAFGAMKMYRAGWIKPTGIAVFLKGLLVI